MSSDLLICSLLFPEAARKLPGSCPGAIYFLAMLGGSQAAIGIVRDRASIGY